MKRASLAAAVTVLALAGCNQPAEVSARRPQRAVREVDQITMLSRSPATVNLDNVPGPDGLVATVYFFQLERNEPVTVSGELEFLLFEGRLDASQAPAEPFHVWRFSPAQLATHLDRGMAGWGYAVELRWPEAPSSAVVTLLARFRQSDGRWLYSAPVVVANSRK